MSSSSSSPLPSKPTENATPEQNNLTVRLHITLHSVAFLLGLSLIFVALGYSAGRVSAFFFDYGNAIRLVAGAFLILMGIIMLKLLPFDFLQRDFRMHMTQKPVGFLASFVVGIAFGAGWTPCIGPVLAGILALASTTGNASQGAWLLAMYSLGFSLPFLLAAQTLPSWRRFNRYYGAFEKVGGILLILVGVLLLTNLTSYLAPFLVSIGGLDNFITSSPNLAVAFIGGVLSFLSPCVLPILPGFLAYLTGLSADQLIR